MTDMMAYDNYRWKNDPIEVQPKLRDLILDGYRELLEAATYLGNEAECAYLKSRIAEFGEGQP